MRMAKNFQSSQYSKFTMSLPYLKKVFRDAVEFLYADKHQSSLQVGFNSNGKKSFLQGAIITNGHDRAFSKVTCLQYLYNISNKMLGMDCIFYMQMNTGFYKLPLLFLMEVARHVQRTQIRKLLILFSIS